MKTIAVYGRISTNDKKQDLLTQLLPLKEYVKQRGWSIYQEYTDTISGSKETRPGLDNLLKDAHKRKFSSVIVFRFDRMGRSAKHLITILETFKTLGIDFISYNEAIDTSTPMGQVIFIMISAFAQFERSIIQERIMAGLHRAKQQGIQLGRPKIKIDTDKLISLKEQGLSIRNIGLKMGLSKSKIERTLKSLS